MLSATLLREARTRAGLSQTELASRVDLPPSVISRWERGEVALNLDRLAMLVHGCGLQFDIALRSADDSERSLVAAYRGLSPAERLDSLQRRVQTVATVQGRPEIFAPRELLESLAGHDVRFLVVGGVAAALHGGPHPTHNLDIVLKPGSRNQARMRRALQALGAGPAGQRGAVEQWETPLGAIQVIGIPAGTAGYPDLIRDATFTDLGDGLHVTVAALADIVRSKDALGRDNERAAVNSLRELARSLSPAGRRLTRPPGEA